ncbi:MAG: IS3 family transposase [Betaproteobacteria bacterium]|nr:IS3 family transposase [Betaproteobacteria bacterium]
MLARDDIADYIDSFYNKVRRHSFLSGISPEQFEKAFKTNKKSVH